MPLPAGEIGLARGYRSASQIARIVSENWVEQHGYCLQCDSDQLRPTARNTPARDFQCDACAHPYELKSSSKPFGNRLVDGAYSTMMERVLKSTVPSFLLLHYSHDWKINSVAGIHHALITPEVIEERRPLSATAKRAGWVGCNILLSGVPPEGRIDIVKDGTAIEREFVRKRFAATERLDDLSLSDRGWASALLLLLHKLNRREFALSDAYAFEKQLALMYPANKHIRPKIRQQLQALRDKGLLVFLGGGLYRLGQPTEHGGAIDDPMVRKQL